LTAGPQAPRPALPYRSPPRRTGAAAGTTTFSYAIGGTVTAADLGGSLAGGTVSFAQGETTQTITLTLTDDQLDELDETVTVTLSNPSGTVVTPVTDPEALRADFPILGLRLHDDVPLVYLDNAATTQRPRQVIQSIVETSERHYANVQRGLHPPSEQSTDAFEKAPEDAPTSNTPRGIRAPRAMYLSGSFRKSTISTSSALAASCPATSVKVTFGRSTVYSRA